MPSTVPWLRKNRQSSSVWFQLASSDSARPARASVGPSSTLLPYSVPAIAHLILGRLAEARHCALHPVRGPCDQLIGIDDRQPEQPDCQRGVGQPGRRLLAADQDRRAIEAPSELCGEIAYWQYLMAADIDRQ